MIRRVMLFLLPMTTLLSVSCGGNKSEVLHTFPVSGLVNLVDSSQVSFDTEISADGNGSIRIVSGSPVTIPLYVVDSVGVSDCRLIYRAKLRTDNFDGHVYLEMLCHFPDLGEYFSRNFDQSISGTNDWTTREAIFFLKPGQVPDRVKLNIGAAGTGTVWIDRLELLKAPL